MQIIIFFTYLLSISVNGIAVRQYSDSSCTQLSKLSYVDHTNCYSFSSTGSYLFKVCNCSLIEYDIYNGGLCFGNVIQTLIANQNTCIDTKQKISCYEDKSSNGSELYNSFFLLSILHLVKYIIDI